MSKSPTPKTPAASSPAANKNPRDDAGAPDKNPRALPKPAVAAQEEGTVFRGVGWAKVKKGWVACTFEIEDGVLVDAEALATEPEPKVIAAETMKLALVRKVIAGSGS